MKDYQSRHEDIERALGEIRPRVFQSNVRIMGDFANALQCAVRLSGAKLSTIVEVECFGGELWAHLSVCCQSPARVPS